MNELVLVLDQDLRVRILKIKNHDLPDETLPLQTQRPRDQGSGLGVSFSS